jgi:hypothetical protein
MNLLHNIGAGMADGLPVDDMDLLEGLPAEEVAALYDAGLLDTAEGGLLESELGEPQASEALAEMISPSFNEGLAMLQAEVDAAAQEAEFGRTRSVTARRASRLRERYSKLYAKTDKAITILCKKYQRAKGRKAGRALAAAIKDLRRPDVIFIALKGKTKNKRLIRRYNRAAKAAVKLQKLFSKIKGLPGVTTKDLPAPGLLNRKAVACLLGAAPAAAPRAKVRRRKAPGKGVRRVRATQAQRRAAAQARARRGRAAAVRRARAARRVQPRAKYTNIAAKLRRKGRGFGPQASSVPAPDLMTPEATPMGQRRNITGFRESGQAILTPLHARQRKTMAQFKGSFQQTEEKGFFGSLLEHPIKAGVVLGGVYFLGQSGVINNAIGDISARLRF